MQVPSFPNHRLNRKPFKKIFRQCRASCYTLFMTAKVCPRCGSQYENFKSTTCPQCFAILVAVDEATAEELSAARAEVEQSPEFLETKAADDERFRQQSFGACLGIAALTLVTLVVVVVLLVSAAHRHSVSRSSLPATVTAAAKEEPLTTLPVAAAGLDDVLPSTIGPYQRQSVDAGIVLTGTLTPLFHGVYRTPVHKTLDVYALPAGRPTAEQNEFRLGLTVAGQMGGASRPALFFATEYWHLAVLAAPGDMSAPPAFRDALAAHFGYTGVSTVRRIP